MLKNDLASLIALVPPGYQWLLRSDETRGYFANLFPDNMNGPNWIEDVTFHCYAPTPEEALQNALYGLTVKLESLLE